MTPICPICKKNPGVVMAFSVSPCDTCYGGDSASIPTAPEDPTGLADAELAAWLKAHPGTVVRYRVFDSCGQLAVKGIARAYYDKFTGMILYNWGAPYSGHPWSYEVYDRFAGESYSGLIKRCQGLSV